MPTVAELERLKALVSRLTPLSSMQRGALVRAEDWNTIVGVLIEIARAVLAEERDTTVPPHDHPDQVKMAWLDPSLRSLVERGPLADPTAISRVTALERRLGRLSNRIEEVATGTKQARDSVAAVTTRDLVREAEVTSIRRTVEGLGDARDDVLALRDTLRSIDSDVRVAVELGSSLIVDGEPVDIAAIVERLQSVEALRDRLILPTGELLDGAELEIRLTELTNTFVTEDELDEALASRPVVVPPGELEAIQESVQLAVMNQLETSIGLLADELNTKIGEELAGVNTLVEQAVSDALPGVTENVLGTLRPEIATAVQIEVKDRLAETAPGSTIDFTRINGLESTHDQRLKEANVSIFSQLASLEPEKIAEITGLSLDEVTSLDIIAQAERLAAGG